MTHQNPYSISAIQGIDGLEKEQFPLPFSAQAVKGSVSKSPFYLKVRQTSLFPAHSSQHKITFLLSPSIASSLPICILRVNTK